MQSSATQSQKSMKSCILRGPGGIFQYSAGAEPAHVGQDQQALARGAAGAPCAPFLTLKTTKATLLVC